MIKRTDIFNHLFSLIILFPVFFSFLFKIIGLPIPSYLFIIVISFSIIFLISNDVLIISKHKLKLVFYLFFIWVLSSIVYTPSIIASKTKCIEILYNTILPVVIIELFFLSSRQRQIELKSFETQLLRYAYILLWFSFIAFILFKQPEVSGRYTIPGVDNAIWFSRFIGMLILIILCNGKLNMSTLAKYSLTLAIGFFLMFAGGSRGPVISVLIVFFIRQSYFISKKNLLLLVITVISIVSIGFIFIGGYLFETDFYSIYARFDLFNALSDFDFQYLMGSGIGSFALLISGVDMTYYPHNIFLEIFFENGLIGIFLFSLMLYLFIRSFKPNVINLLFVYYLITSLVSGDIPGNNNLFIILYISTYSNQNYQLKKLTVANE